MFQYNACRHQLAPIAGTVFHGTHGTKLQLAVWFLAIYLISRIRIWVRALALERPLGVGLPDRVSYSPQV
ncbi:MAG: hypothetical protein DVS81_15970 [Candidatus Accumulibacter meliphilus]|jgi:hypothetical protein|uniref:Mobile element protein n=1 Tax=Candidatus Accumulibacter meliphilus TaxID=2211374 RepID=A0A369XKZ1_9PROT|nr:MAG: hypothetical protein DVS81_15970 [Candidatus Accumulibacter meliphilus]